MRTTFLFLTLLLTSSLFAQGWGSKKLRGNGDVTKETRNLRTFTGIDVCCNIDVEIRRGNTQKVVVEAESNVLEYIETNVSGGRLDIGFRRDVNMRNVKQVSVYVTMKELDYLGASSSSSVVTLDEFRGRDIELDASSAGRIKCAFSGKDATLEASSGAKITLRGEGTKVRAKASSGGKANAENFKAKRGRADASSGATVHVHTTEGLDAEASSGGSVRYDGTPANVDIDTSSGGTVRRR